MKTQFSIDSIEYFAEKFVQCRSLSDESLSYLTEQTSAIVVCLLQDAAKFLCKCHRQMMTINDFEFALKLHYVEPFHGGYSSTSLERFIFRKIRKDNRVLHQIDDQIIELNQLTHRQPKVPLDISLRAHWLAIDGQQPTSQENPIIHRSLRPSKKRPNDLSNRSHLLSTEQEIYYKQIIEMSMHSDELKRKQVLLILGTDCSLQQIINQLSLFISEGIRINLSKKCNQSLILTQLMEMSEAILQNSSLDIEPFLHHFYPAILSCLLEQRLSVEYWSLRDLAAKCSGLVLRKYSTAANRLQQRTIDLFNRILQDKEEEKYNWSTRYGALIGLCEMGPKIILQFVFPLLKSMGEEIRRLNNEEMKKKITDILLKFVVGTCRSNQIEIENEEKNFLDDFGSYFAPLIQHELVLLL